MRSRTEPTWVEATGLHVIRQKRAEKKQSGGWGGGLLWVNALWTPGQQGMSFQGPKGPKPAEVPKMAWQATSRLTSQGKGGTGGSWRPDRAA